MFAGTVVGVLIGVVTSIATLVTLKPFFGGKSQGSQMAAVCTQLLGLPAFWFGGPWLTTRMLQSFEFTEFVQPYIVSLALSYLLVIAFPLVRWVRWLGLTMGKDNV
jgi:hypothetical protein